MHLPSNVLSTKAVTLGDGECVVSDVVAAVVGDMVVAVAAASGELVVVVVVEVLVDVGEGNIAGSITGIIAGIIAAERAAASVNAGYDVGEPFRGCAENGKLSIIEIITRHGFKHPTILFATTKKECFLKAASHNVFILGDR